MLLVELFGLEMDAVFLWVLKSGSEERRPAEDAVRVESVRWRFDVGLLGLWLCPIVAVLAKLILDWLGLVGEVDRDRPGVRDDDSRVWVIGEPDLDEGCTITHVPSCAVLDFLVAWGCSSSSSVVEVVGISVQLLSSNSWPDLA